MNQEQMQQFENGLDQALSAANTSENKGNEINMIASQMISEVEGAIAQHTAEKEAAEAENNTEALEIAQGKLNLLGGVKGKLDGLQAEAQKVFEGGHKAAKIVGELKQFLSQA